MQHVVVIGNGIAGVTAARHIRKFSEKKITIISGESEHFWSRTALMYIYMGHMKYEHTKPYEDWFWKKNRINLVKGWVNDIDFKGKKCFVKEGPAIEYDILIIATGSITKYYDWPGQHSKGVVGMVSLQDLESIEKWAPNKDICNNAVIVGGGLIGIEMAEMLNTREIPTTMLVREKNFWGNVLPHESAAMISHHIQSHGIHLQQEEELNQIIPNSEGKVKAIETKLGKILECDFVGICTGVRPQIDWLKHLDIEIDTGILVDSYLKTNQENVYAIGDCAEQRETVGARKPIEALWYTGRMMGETVAQTVCGNPVKWNPGVWFNSAKFFDIEYQTYGHVWHKPAEGNEHYHWQDSEKLHAIDIEYEISSRKVVGINTFGIRMKHKTWDMWIREGKTIDYTLKNIKQACFDPEFSKTKIPSL